MINDYDLNVVYKQTNIYLHHRDQILHLSVYDRDFASKDDLIGSTSIDIEDRFRSKHLPCFGLPNYFTSKGCNKWRHQMKPSEMLLDLCERHRVEKPRIEGRKIIIGKAEFKAEVLTANECLTEQLCLLALNNFKHVVNGFSLTPEHVETRSLYHPKRGGIEQGKVQLWIELYEPSRPHPLPIDITPQLPKPYELRLIVWNTADVMLNERNIFGTEMSDIYVKWYVPIHQGHVRLRDGVNDSQVTFSFPPLRVVAVGYRSSRKLSTRTFIIVH